MDGEGGYALPMPDVWDTSSLPHKRAVPHDSPATRAVVTKLATELKQLPSVPGWTSPRSGLICAKVAPQAILAYDGAGDFA